MTEQALQESMLIVPQRDNDGRDLSALRDSVAADLTAAFGGVTMTEATGCWEDRGTLYREPVTELVAACADTAESRATLEREAHKIAHDGRQLAVYLREPNGRVEIVRPDE